MPVLAHSTQVVNNIVPLAWPGAGLAVLPVADTGWAAAQQLVGQQKGASRAVTLLEPVPTSGRQWRTLRTVMTHITWLQSGQTGWGKVVSGHCPSARLMGTCKTKFTGLWKTGL